MSEEINLPGEGDVELVRRTRVRVECENCGEYADQRHTYLLPNARRNPASSGYGGDDISRCSDHEYFSCAACRKQYWHDHEPPQQGYEWCGTYSIGKQFAHLFLRWSEKKLPHDSDCATHNEPAMPNGPCDCSISEQSPSGV